VSATEQRAYVDRNLALELVRTTEYAALAAARWIGRGEKEAADQAAVDAMRLMLDTVRMDGVVVIGEGEKDEAPMLYNGERIGDGTPPEVDIAVDPLEGTDLTAKGFPGALATIALSERGSMFNPGPIVYMEKMVCAPSLSHLLEGGFERPLHDTLRQIAYAKGTDIRDVMVMMLDRPRHEQAVKEVREAGARIRFILHGDVAGALLAATEGSPVDLLYGIGGGIIGRLWPRSDEERQAAIDQGYDLDEVLDQDRLCSGDNIFFACTGVTDGDLLQGVRYEGPQGATTESLVTRSRSGTVRRIMARHDRQKLRALVGERLG
jgi:fructose-1,6-bisphosphatase II